MEFRTFRSKKFRRLIYDGLRRKVKSTHFLHWEIAKAHGTDFVTVTGMHTMPFWPRITLGVTLYQ